jgi:hypothetical protein
MAAREATYEAVPSIDLDVKGREVARDVAPRDDVGMGTGGSDEKWIIRVSSPTLARWHLLILFMIAVDVLIIPLEVSFDQLERSIPTLRIVIEIIFVVDTFVPFFLQTMSADGTYWMSDLSTIAKLRLQGPFWIDFLSILPLEPIVTRHITFATVQELRAHQNWKMLEYLYFAKLLRIFQLLRVTRLSRVAGEWRFNFGLSYNGGLVTITVMIIFTALHFAACMWASLCRPNFEYSWLQAFHSTHSSGGIWSFNPHPGPVQIYGLALYWSLFTVTSIGYGDIYPQAQAEYFVANLGMLAGGMLWACVVANIVTVASSLDDRHEEHQKALDKARVVVRHREEILPEGCYETVEQFFNHLDVKQQCNRTASLARDLSPTLQVHVTQRVYAFMIQNSFMSRMTGACAASMCLAFNYHLNSPAELTIFARVFCVCVRGVAFFRSSLIQRGKSWGEDFMISKEDMRQSSQALAVTYLTIATLGISDFDEVLTYFPDQIHIRRRMHTKMTLLRGLTRVAERAKAAREESTPSGMFVGLQKAAKNRKIYGQRDSLVERINDIMAGTYVAPEREDAFSLAKSVKKQFADRAAKMSGSNTSFTDRLRELTDNLEKLEKTATTRLEELDGQSPH